jgi:hypothetical protein
MYQRIADHFVYEDLAVKAASRSWRECGGTGVSNFYFCFLNFFLVVPFFSLSTYLSHATNITLAGMVCGGGGDGVR